jgi:hypothetical protein
VRGTVTIAAATALVYCGIVAAAHAEALTAEDVDTRVRALIEASSKDGVFTLQDVRSGETLALVLDDIRAVRGLPEHGWFPDVIFHDRAAPEKKYAVDFWLKPKGDDLDLVDVQIHKAPVPDGDSWMMLTRRPLLWWWLPTLKRASAISGVQAWQVMGQIHAHIADQEEDGIFPLVLPGGKTVPTDLLAIHQPVGRNQEDGRYFACVALRKKGDPVAAYAVDFWVDPDAGSVTVGNVRFFESPRADDGNAAARPPCLLEGIAFDVVE